MEGNVNALNWFEISAKDLARVRKFYETIFSITMVEYPDMVGVKMFGFPIDPMSGKVGGAICESEFHTPSQDGALVCLNANPSVQAILDKVEAAGGKVVMPRTQISPEIGYIAFFIDTEGNRVALHGNN